MLIRLCINTYMSYILMYDIYMFEINLPEINFFFFEEVGYINYRPKLIIFLCTYYLENLFTTTLYQAANIMKMNMYDIIMRSYYIGDTPMSGILPGEWARGRVTKRCIDLTTELSVH